MTADVLISKGNELDRVDRPVRQYRPYGRSFFYDSYGKALRRTHLLHLNIKSYANIYSLR